MGFEPTLPFCKFFGNPILQTHHMKASRSPPPSVIPFWKPLMIPDLDPNSDAKILQIFLQPYFAKPVQAQAHPNVPY